jgi:hypothetical protein
MCIGIEIINDDTTDSSSSKVSYTLFFKVLSLRYRHNLSTGFSSGEYGGKRIIFIFAGIFSPLCHQALSMTKIIGLSNVLANSSRKTCIYSLFTPSMIKLKLSPLVDTAL